MAAHHHVDNPSMKYTVSDKDLLDAVEQFKINSFKNKLPNLLDEQYIAKPYSEQDYNNDIYTSNNPHNSINNNINNHLSNNPYPPLYKLYIMQINQTSTSFGLVDKNNKPLDTVVWGYKNITNDEDKDICYSPGKTIIAYENESINVLWLNNLIDNNGQMLKHILPVDTTLHMANAKNGIPTVTHLHGGMNADTSDGGPESWFTPGFRETGETFTQKLYQYNNQQEAGNLFYHDHAMGITRLNVYAGLLGEYFIRDNNEKYLMEHNSIPSYPYECPLILQEKQFYNDGSLYYPDTIAADIKININVPFPSVVPEFLSGQSISIINGKAWPYMDVEKTLYRFRIINASQSRFYNLYLRSDKGQVVNFIQIGSDLGFINMPNIISEFLLGPAMRLDIIIDFTNLDIGQKVYLLNNASAPYKAMNDNVSNNNGNNGIINRDDENLSIAMKNLMIFRIVKERDEKYPLIKLPDFLRPISGAIIHKYIVDNDFIFDIANNVNKIRQLLLYESTDKYGRMLPLLGTIEKGMMKWSDEISEIVNIGHSEIWQIYNTTKDSHTIHLHACHFHVINRQYFTAEQDMNGRLTNIILSNDIIKPYSYEYGKVDTCVAYPGNMNMANMNMTNMNSKINGMITRIMIKFTIAGNYVWHCHMLEHEDNEMMRPLIIH